MILWLKKKVAGIESNVDMLHKGSIVVVDCHRAYDKY
jgi:hypothetical protein